MTYLPTLYRGVSRGIKYTGFDWHAKTYLTSHLETAAIYGRLGTTRRALIQVDLDVADAGDTVVRDIERAANPSRRAKALGIDAVWNASGQWIGKVHPYEFIVFANVPIRYAPLTRDEQEFVDRVKSYLKERRS